MNGLQAQVERALLPSVQVRGEDVHFTLAERMAQLRVPGLSIAVFDQYELVWAKGYGEADVETHESVSDSTLFQAGSISKSVNALAVLLAVADGALKLDVPVNELLRSWKLPDNELTQESPVTLRRLLSHTAGTTVHGFPGYRSSAGAGSASSAISSGATPVPTLLQVLDGSPPANTPAVRVDLKPGSRFRYSGGGISITQLALMDALGKPYPAILDEHVLVPLGMQNSTFQQPLPPERLKRAAAGHQRDGSVVPSKRFVYPEMAAAGLWTTPTDLAIFFLEISRARAHRSTKLSPEIATLMTTEVDPESHSALGVFLLERNAAALFGHNGADTGFQADASASLDHGYGVVVMANSDNGFRIFPEIERTVFAAMNWPGADMPIALVALGPLERARLAGRFTSEDGLPFAITGHADGLFVVRPFAAPVRLVAVEPGDPKLPPEQRADVRAHIREELASREPSRVPVIFHVAQRDGQGVAPASFIAEQLARANAIYVPLGLELVDGARVPLAPEHAELVTRSDRDALARYVRTGAIHCFVVAKLMDVDEPGRERRGVHWHPRTPPRQSFLIVSQISGPYVLAHELGHLFGNREHSLVPGNLMSYTRSDRPPFLDEAQIRRVQRTLATLLKTRALVPVGAP